MTDKVAVAALAALSEAFATRDLGGALACFADDPAATYAGSEQGEIAIGASQLRALFTDLLSRPETYRFDEPKVRTSCHDSLTLVLADLAGHTDGPDGPEDFPYRITGVLRLDGGRWRWLQLHGSEPTA